MKYKYLLFDFDDTLLDFKKTEYDAFHNAMERCGLKNEEGYLEIYSEINHMKWMQLNEGLLTKNEIFNTRFQEFFDTVGIDYDSALFNQTYLKALSEPVHYVKDVVEVLRELSKDHEIYVVTNGLDAVQQPRLARSEFQPYIKEVFVSEVIGYEKPQLEYFDAVFAKIPGIQKEETLIIGDSLTSDIRGGNQAGIATCWFNPEGKPHNGIDHADYEIQELSELLEIVGIQ